MRRMLGEGLVVKRNLHQRPVKALVANEVAKADDSRGFFGVVDAVGRVHIDRRRCRSAHISVVPVADGNGNLAAVVVADFRIVADRFLADEVNDAALILAPNLQCLRTSRPRAAIVHRNSRPTDNLRNAPREKVSAGKHAV